MDVNHEATRSERSLRVRDVYSLTGQHLPLPCSVVEGSRLPNIFIQLDEKPNIVVSVPVQMGGARVFKSLNIRPNSSIQPVQHKSPDSWLWTTLPWAACPRYDSIDNCL